MQQPALARPEQDSAWRWVLAAKSWAEQYPEQTAYKVGPLHVAADGSWHSDTDLSARDVAILDLYLPLCIPCRSFVLAQIGQSLDGRIATESGVSRDINGPDGMAHLHRLRALVDAVVVGSSTAMIDDPQLTVRHCDGESPVRVVIDRRRRVPDTHQIFQDDQAPTLRLVQDSLDHSTEMVTDIALPVVAPDQKNACRAADIFNVLQQQGLRRILIEGGGDTVSRFLDAGLLDYLHVIVAPMIIGSGRPGFSLPALDTLEGALRPRHHSVNLGSDVVFALTL